MYDGKKYTFVIRSKDRVYGDTSDFRIALPYNGALAEHHDYRISIVKSVFPKSDHYHFWNASGVYYEPAATVKHINSEFVEIHLNFGSPTHGHDTAVGGPRLVHIVNQRLDGQLHSSDQNDAIYYDVSRPNLTELHVQVKDKFGQPAGVMIPSSYPTFGATVSLANLQTALPEWVFVLCVEIVEKKSNQ